MAILCIHNYYRIRAGEDIMFDKICHHLKVNHSIIKYTKKTHKNIYLNIIKMFIKKLLFIDLIKILIILNKNKNIKFCYIQNLFPLININIIRLIIKKNIKIIFRVSNYRLLCPNSLFYRNNKICKLCYEKSSNLSILKYNCENNYLKSIYSFIRTTRLQNFIINYDINLLVQTHYQLKLYSSFINYKNNSIYKINNIIDDDFEMEEREIPFENFFILSGRDSKEKGFDEIIAFFERKNKFNLVVTSSNKKNKKFDNIFYTNYLTKKQNLFVLNKAKALICNYQWLDISPNVILESMAMGTLVLSNKVDSLSEILIHKETCLIYENNIKSLEKYLEIINQDNHDKKIIDQARNFVKENYSAKKFIENIENLFVN